MTKAFQRCRSGMMKLKLLSERFLFHSHFFGGKMQKEMIEAKQLSDDELKIHEYWMQEALTLAKTANQLGEVPIGAIIVRDNQIIGQGYNLKETDERALAHAEIEAIESANRFTESWRLEGATMYVTLEPCPMCAGALINSRIQTLVYGASDQKSGCVGSLMNLLSDNRFNHQLNVIRGVLAEESSDLLKRFFKELRNKRKQ